MLQVEHLTRRYGKVTAVDDLSFEISDDGVYGFLGPNGAGKSTTMNIMTGCLSATSGTVRISGYDIYEQPKEAKRRIGYLPEQALLGTPEIVILDEPTVGLDPLQILEIRLLIASLGRSRTVLISSHILSEVQTMCSKILIIAHGKLVAFDAPEKLEERLAAPGEITITAETDAQRARALVEALPGVAGITVKADGPDRSQLAVASGTEDIYALSRSIFQTFADSGCALCELGVKKPSLEDIFLELTEGGETP